MTLSDFDDIRPFSEGEMKPAFESMLADRQFDKILRGLIPLPKGLRNGLLKHQDPTRLPEAIHEAAGVLCLPQGDYRT